MSLTILLLKRDKILNLIKILSLFFIALVIANINLLIVNFQNITFHREEFVRLTLSFKESLFFFINNLISLPLQTGWAFFKQLPLVFYKLPIICLAFFSKDKNVKRILLIVVLTSFTLTLISNKFFGSFINDRSGFIRTISWSYILNSYYILYCLIGIFILKKINFFNNILIIFIFISLFLFQINSSIVPFAKKIIFKEKKYQNLYTFKEYYYFYNYEKIKQIVGTNKVMSIGLDPMVATVHGIYVIDGYYSLYPQEYKKRFREIIEEELNINPYYKKYFDEWGSRLYTTLYRPKNIDLLSLNYDKAKNIGAKYIISSLKLNSEKLELIYGNCDEENFCLYKIK